MRKDDYKVLAEYYCETCKEFVTNKWAIIGNKHVGCPKAN